MDATARTTIDRENEDAPNEYDATDGHAWTAADLFGDLRAVGQPEDTTGWDRPSTNRPTA
jgi:hypothetical protein